MAINSSSSVGVHSPENSMSGVIHTARHLYHNNLSSAVSQLTGTNSGSNTYRNMTHH
jgi:hypothetical protein